MPIKIITPPAVEPVTFDEVKLQVKLDVDDERDLIEGIYIPAAREDCEDFHGWSYVERTLEYVLDRWPSGDRIYLPRPPVQEIESVYYLNPDGEEVSFTDWLPSLDGDPAVLLKPGCSWPTAKLYPAGAVRVRYVSGYPAKESDPCGNIPFAVKAAILQTVASYVENREAVAGRGHIPQRIPGTAEDLLWKTRYFWCEELNR